MDLNNIKDKELKSVFDKLVGSYTRGENLTLTPLECVKLWGIIAEVFELAEVLSISLDACDEISKISSETHKRISEKSAEEVRRVLGKLFNGQG